MRMQTMTSAEFEARCHEILVHVPAEGLSITVGGKPVAVIYPEKVNNSKWIGSMPDMQIRGDIFSTGLEWDACRGLIDGE